MSLAAALSRYVPSKLRQRGAEYLARNLVRLSMCSDLRVEATVTGTEEYEVTLERDERLVEATCTCPFFADRNALCKHIWATVLAADVEGALRGPRGGLPNELVSGFIRDDSLLYDGDDDLAELKIVGPFIPAPPLQAPPAPSWRDFLVSISAATSLQPVRDDEILYLIDLPASMHRKALTLDILTFKRKQDGGRGALQQLRLTRGQIAELRDPADRELLTLFVGAMRGDPWASWYYTQHHEVPLQPAVPDEIAQEVAQRLCATGRCHLRTGPKEIVEEALRWDEGPPWELWLAVREAEDGSCDVVPELRRPGRRQARPGGRHHPGRPELDGQAEPGGSRAAAVVTGGARHRPGTVFGLRRKAPPVPLPSPTLPSPGRGETGKRK